MKELESCGYCLGAGNVMSSAYDAEGRQREPYVIVCKYCNGSGKCEDGMKLLPHGTKVKNS